MDAGVALHVFPQELHPQIHQLHRVQGAASVLGIPGGMGGDSPETVQHLGAGVVGSGGDLVGIPGMPAQRRVQLPPDPLPGEIGLRRSALLPGTAVKKHGAGKTAALQKTFDAAGRREGRGPQHIVSAAMTGAAGDQGTMRCLPRSLTQTGEGVKLAQDADDGSPAAVGAREGGGDASQAIRHGEAFFLQLFLIQRRRAVFPETQLRKFPDLMGKGGKFAAPFFDPILRFFFPIHISTAPCSKTPSSWGSGDCS